MAQLINLEHRVFDLSEKPNLESAGATVESDPANVINNISQNILPENVAELFKTGAWKDTISGNDFLFEKGMKHIASALNKGLPVIVREDFDNNEPVLTPEQIEFSYQTGLNILNTSNDESEKEYGIKLILKAADLGCSKAAADCSLFFAGKSNGFPLDFNSAHKYAKLAEAKGCEAAAIVLGYCYDRGFAVKADPKIAGEHYLTAIANNDTNAIKARLYLCALHLKNPDVFFPLELESLYSNIEWLRDNKATLKLNDTLYVHLLFIECKCYLYGVTVEKNIQKALEFAYEALEYEKILTTKEVRDLRQLEEKYS